MTNKRCLIYETLGKVSDLKVMESAGDGLMRLEGVFGVCGVKNQNNRVYDKENYKQMVESLQKVIKETGCPGELEHPNSMNINLENVSHKIESIQMNEDGTITGTIVLLNTPKGQIAQAIVEGGLPLFISSRGAGSITTEGRVTLSTIKTYDLVGTPGFSQAKLSLKSNQTLECLNESVEDGNIMYAIVEGDDDLLGDGNDDNKDSGDDLLSDGDDEKKDKKDDSNDDLLGDNDDKEDKDKEEKKKKKEKKDDEKSDKKKEKKEEESDEDKKDKKEDNKNKDKENIDMNDLKEAIDKLTDKVTSLEAELHVAKESLEETKSQMPSVNYEAIEQWVNEEFAPNFRETVQESLKNMIKEEANVEELIDTKVNEAIETISKSIQNWVIEEFSPEVQNWITEEFSPEVQNWVTEEFAPKVQEWITEEFAPEVQNWITEEFAPVIDSWVNEEFGANLETKINENVNSFMESQKAGRLEEIDALLESVDAAEDNSAVAKIVKENTEENKFKGVFVVENMPAQYQPSWQTLNEERKEEIIRSSRMYDFTKEGVLESFWANVDFEKTTPVMETKEENNDVVSAYHNNIMKQMMHLRNANF